MTKVTCCWAAAAYLLLAGLAARADNTRISPTGKQLFENCAACHTLEEDGDSGIGPNLWGLFGARAASKTDFAYSDALRASKVVWNDEALDRWLTSPSQFIPGNKMPFVGLANPEERLTLITYLKAKTAK